MRDGRHMASAFLSSGLHSTTTPKLQGSNPHSAPISVLLPPQSCQFLCRVDICNRYNLHVSGKRRPIPWKGSGHSFHVTMGVKLVETYDGSFQLEPQSEQLLKSLLSSQVFCNQVAQQTGIGVDGDSSFEFTGELFQPVPWSITTKHGMPEVCTAYSWMPLHSVPTDFFFLLFSLWVDKMLPTMHLPNPGLLCWSAASLQYLREIPLDKKHLVGCRFCQSFSGLAPDLNHLEHVYGDLNIGGNIITLA